MFTVSGLSDQALYLTPSAGRNQARAGRDLGNLTDSRPPYIPVILGTPRKGRMSEHVGRLLAGEVGKQPGVETELIDICSSPLPTDDAGEAIKDGGFSSKMDRADGLVIVAPEYNHGYCRC